MVSGSICFPIENVENCVLYDLKTGVCQDCEAGYYRNLATVELGDNLYTTAGSSSINGVACMACEIPNCGQCDSAYAGVVCIG